MVAIHTGMSDQTSSNVARDGAAKKPQTKFATTHGMRDRTAEMTGVSPANPGVGPDAAPGNPLSPSAKLKQFPEAPIKSGMRDANGGTVSNVGKAVLAEAANLGR